MQHQDDNDWTLFKYQVSNYACHQQQA